MSKLSKQVCLLLLLLFPIMSAPVAKTQVSEIAIVGSVRDVQGAVVPQAEVVLRDEATNVSRSTTTNDVGAYLFNGLMPGTYSVETEVSGFKKALRTGLVLEVGERARIDFTLQPGSVSQTVTVDEREPLLDTQTDEVSQVISNREILELPLNGRTFNQLENLVPGVVNGTVVGNQYFKNNFTLDGVDDVHALSTGVAETPSLDEIEQFNIQTGGISAADGRFGTSQVHLVTKRGTNAFNGSLYDFFRNDALDARPYFLPATGTKAPLRQNQYGVTLGGPIKKDNLFFMFTWEGLRSSTPSVGFGTTPTAAMRNGDLTELGVDIYDPATYDPTTGQRQQFSGNVIPADRIDPVAKKALDLMFPDPTIPGYPNNRIVVTSAISNFDKFSGRVDWSISSKSQLFFRFSHDNLSQDYTYPTQFPVQDSFKPYHVVVGDTSTFTRAFINDVRLGYHRESSYLVATAPSNIQPQLGIDGATRDGAPAFSITPFGSFGELNTYVLLYNTYQLVDDLTYLHNNHSFRFGGDVRLGQWTREEAPWGRPSYSFTGFATADPDNQGATGSGFADFLLGLPASITFTRSFYPSYVRENTLAIYAQDDWRIAPRLTLNLGLRYELATRPAEKYNRWTNFDPSTGKIAVAVNDQGQIAPGVDPQSAAQYANLYLPANQTSLPIHALAFGDHDDFAPRIGFAWRPPHFNNTSIRASYGIYYNLSDGNFEINRENSFLWSTTESYNNSVLTAPSLSLDHSLGNNGTLQSMVSPPMVDPYARDGYVQQWNFDVQQSFLSNWVADLGYVGSNSHHLEMYYAYNQPNVGLGAIQPRRPYPLFSPFTINASAGHANYNAFLAKVQNRPTKNLTLLASYTYSRVLDNTTGELTVNNPYNREADWGPSSYSFPNNVSIAYVYALPVGSQQHWLNTKGIVNHVLGGWELTGIVSYYTGPPFSPMVNGDFANVGQAAMRPDCIGNGALDNPTISRWFNVSAYAVPQNLTWGDCPKNILRQDSFKDWDSGFFKNFPIRKRAQLQFRSEFFNATNTPSFGAPNATINTPTAGQVTSTASSPRAIQLALKILF